ncbi:MAG TPA: enoyl-CoA hydratase-related protein [Saprospiraceae bacterium]|nr:enoyl-CoA hydratase-related protein [Saprospiraceae bacterium]
MDYKYLIVEVEEGVALVTINRPKALNAINRELMLEIQKVFKEDLTKREIHGAIITGAGEKAFVAGADIKGFMDFSPEEASKLSREGHETYNAIEDFHRPVIAAVNGFALGGGCELAMACHMRVAEENARFGQPEVNLGLIPGYAGTQRLPQLIGIAKATELLLTGDMINAEESLALGLVNHVVEKGQSVIKAKEIIGKVATKAPLAIEETLRCLRAFQSKTEDGYELEIDRFGWCFGTEDFKEGTSAFLEKRKPEFKNK